MPYLSKSKSATITAQEVTVTLEVSPTGLWVAGQTVTLRAKVTADGSPVANHPVRFWFIVKKVNAKLIGGVSTNSEGVAELKWTVPWTLNGDTLPCYEHKLQAELYPEGIFSNYVTIKIAYPTDLSLNVPDKVLVGQSFRISGKLLYESAKDTWSGLPNKTVNIYVNGKLIKSVTTGSDGSFEVWHTFDTPGTYTITAEFPGEGLATAALAKTAVSPASLPRPTISPLPQMIAGGLMLLAGIL